MDIVVDDDVCVICQIEDGSKLDEKKKITLRGSFVLFYCFFPLYTLLHKINAGRKINAVLIKTALIFYALIFILLSCYCLFKESALIFYALIC